MMNFVAIDPGEPEPPRVPYHEEWERTVAAPPPATWFGIDVRPNYALSAKQRHALDRLIERCPGPWAPGEPLPPDTRVRCALWCDEVVGYMACKVSKCPYKGWIWDDAGCPTLTVLRVAVLPCWRKNGVGRRLVEEGEAEYAGLDPGMFPGAEPTIRAVTRVPRDCTEGRLFFGSLGYGVVNRWFPGPYSMERTRTFTVPKHEW